jgi:outer membrane protein assembly factor BamD (BamD/ComL family)
MKLAIVLTALFLLASAGTAWSNDQIYLSTKERPVFGKITAMTPASITLDISGGQNEIAANEIKRITFENSPGSLMEAQKALLDGDYEKADEALKKETVEDKRPEIAQEIAFCKAYCAAMLTLSGDVETADAGRRVAAFLKEFPNSFHYYTACEAMGDLCVAAGKFDAAQQFFGKLSQAPWPDYQIRAQVALGRSYLAQNNAAAADKAFDEAIGNGASGQLADAQRAAAQIGKARCMVLNDKPEGALRSLGDIIDKLDDRNPEIAAMAYNAQGTACRKAGKPDKAVLAFLRVHLMYNLQPDADAEAVANLEKLFTETHKPKHAQDMRAILNERYKNSRWAKGGVK